LIFYEYPDFSLTLFETFLMKTADLKHRILTKIESLDKKGLEEAYGVLINFFNSRNVDSEWSDLSKKQQEGILLAAKQLDEGKGIAHKKVMKKCRHKHNG